MRPFPLPLWSDLHGEAELQENCPVTRPLALSLSRGHNQLAQRDAATPMVREAQYEGLDRGSAQPKSVEGLCRS